MTNLNSFTQKISLRLINTQGRIALFSFGFIVLAVFVPWLAHQFHLFGPGFLPLHFFALLAGLAFGSVSGLLVGVLSPISSFFFSGMPTLIQLPILVPEIATYGLISGVLKKKNPYLALFTALLAGRLVVILMATILLPPHSQFAYLANTIRTGLPGILLQILLVPVLAQRLKRLI